VFDGLWFARLDSRVSNMFEAGMRTTLSFSAACINIVSSVFDQTCWNRLATHFNISMFGHQTMFDGRCLVAKHFPFVRALTAWSVTSTLACLVTKQCLMVFGCQTFPVCPGPYNEIMIEAKFGNLKEFIISLFVGTLDLF